jgi:glutamyl-tRNA synthetase
MSTKIRTRFAPSPTGELHIGGLRTALYSYGLAKHASGDFILRIEDTDKKREVAGSKEKIIKLLEKFGLKWDEYSEQSKRAEEGIYKKKAEELVSKGHAFYCDCKPKNAKEEGYSKELRDPCRDANKTSGAIKLKVPDNEAISFKDFVLEKEVAWDTNAVSDTTLLKSDGFPTYHLAVVVDDHDMEITHVLRGHDWMPSTPVHLLVYKYLGFELPQIGHLTDILDPEGGKLSKRKGSTTCEGLFSEGYLPEAILNFVMLLGWAPKDNRELFALEEFVKAFDPQGFQKSNPVFNREKLDWFNGHYIREKPEEELLQALGSFLPKGAEAEKVKQTIPLIKDRMKKLSEFETLAGYVFKKASEIKPIKITQNYDPHIASALEALKGISQPSWNLAGINGALGKAIEENKFKVGDFYMDLRGTISGSKYTPPLNETLVLIGREDTLDRLEKGLKEAK